MTHDDNSNRGPLRFLPSPPDVATARTIQESLRGHASAANWIKEDLSPELDALRSEHLRVRAQVIEDQQEVAELAACWRAEDAEYEERLRQAHREGRPDDVEDRRTPMEQREAEDARALERYWAGVRVLGEKVDAIRDFFRRAEPELLAELRSRLVPAQEKRREAQQLLDEARTEEWHIYKLGMWVQAERDAGLLGAQPAPIPEPPPKQFNAGMLERAMERPYYREEEPVVAWQDQSPRPAGTDDELGTDETGDVSELIETGGEGAAS